MLIHALTTDPPCILIHALTTLFGMRDTVPNFLAHLKMTPVQNQSAVQVNSLWSF